MDNRFNTIAGWTLAAFGTALGLSIAGGMLFDSGHPEKEGYPVEAAAEAGGEGGGEAEQPIAALLASADATKGADVFKKCSACHTITPGGAAGVGPNLHGVMGKPIAGGAFAYSDALKGVGGNWDWDKMNAWLKSPRKFADGTKMTFAGLSNPQDRANVILYLNQQGSNLPLPAAPAPGATTDPAAGGNAPGTEGGQGQAAAPGANTAVEAVETDRRAETGSISNTGTPASGAPSVDPAAARQGAKVGGK
jgi:cytochrome c